jgi:hypothetical protein
MPPGVWRRPRYSSAEFSQQASKAKTVSQCPYECSRACPRIHARSRPSASVFDQPQIEWHKSAASRGSVPGRHLFGTPDDIILERLCGFIGTRVEAHFGKQLRGAHIITYKEYKEIPELTAADFARGTLTVCDRSRVRFRAAVAKVIRAWEPRCATAVKSAGRRGAAPKPTKRS